MKIGILGAPGAGKSKFAGQLDIELHKRDYDPFLIIDNYVRDLQADTGQEYGHFGTHVDDLQVVFKRRECELMYGSNDQHIITVGTVLDSAIHCFSRVEEVAQTHREIGLQQERLRTIAGAFGLLYTDTWDYDYAFYLPYEGDSERSRLHDTSLRALMGTYRAPIFSIATEVSDDEKAPTAARAIAALEAEQLSTPPERRVQSSSEAGEADGDSSESVPDVPEQGRASDDT